MPRKAPRKEIEDLRAQLAEAENRLAEAQEVIRAIQSGDIDAVVVSGQVFTLKGAEYTYRALVEAMNEGAATLAGDGTVLYCNQLFSQLVGVPLEQITGNHAAKLVCDEHKATFDSLFTRALSGSAEKAEIHLSASHGRRIPVYVSLRGMNADEPAAVCMVVTDLTEHKKRDELIHAGELANSILESAAEAIAVCDESGKIIRVNEALEELCGFNPLFKTFDEAFTLDISEGLGATAQRFSVSSALGATSYRVRKVTFRRNDGQDFSLLLSSERFSTSSGVTGCVLTLTDITEETQRENKLQKLNRTLSASSNSNQALLHAATEHELLQHICRIITDDCGHAMVWIGFAENDDEKTVRPMAWAGFEEGYLDTLRITWADNERGRGPTGSAIRTGQPSVCGDMLTDPRFKPWRAEALKRGYRSSLVLPLKASSNVLGAITIYSREPNAFGDDEIRLLMGVATDLAYGIDTLRTRVARDCAEAELRDSQEWLRVTLSSIGDAVLATDVEGRIIFLNPVAAELTGWNPQEAKGQPSRNVFRIINEETHRPADDVIARVLHEHRVVALANHTALVARDGREVPIEDSAAPILDRDGNVVGAVLVFHDVTEKRRADEARRLSEEKFAKIFAGNPAAIALTRLEDGLYIDVNDTWVSLFGYSREEAIGQSARKIGVWPSSDAAARFVEELRQKGALHGWEQEFTKKSGETFTVQLSAQVLIVRGEKLALSTLVDITPRKRAEEALRESEAKFRSLFESSPDAVLLTIPDGRVLAANPAACAMFGMSEAEICRVGRQGLADKNDARFTAAEEERLRTKRLCGAELNFVRANGERFPAEVDSVILPGEAPRSFVIMRDITDRKRTERALIQSEKLASVGRLASTIAHEINNPLETIGHAIYLAETDPGSSEQAKSYLKMADQQLERVAHITKQTLAFHREDTTPARIDLRESVEGVLKIFEARMQSRGIAIERRYETVDKILACGSEIQQVVSNLLTNSMDALSRGGKLYLHVSPSFRTNGSRGVRLTIGDTGSGITPECQKRIFEPFFTTKEVVGTGLGLWITKQIIQRHGATIRLRSKVEKGTVFSIVFPSASVGNLVKGSQ